MGRERRVDGPSAARPPQRFELDLTSVCVRSGAVQLPYRLQGAFAEGPVAAVDADGGASLDLEFRPPRALMGLRAFFDAHQLRPNDSLGLEFTETGLRLEAIRRERKAPAGAARPASARKASESAPPRREAGEAPGSGRKGRQGAAPAAPPDRARDDAPRSAASSAPPSLRMATPPPSEPATSRDESAPPQAAPRAPRWEPLDGLTQPAPRDASTTEAPGQDVTAEPEAPMHRVREIRRGSPLRPQGTRPPAQEEHEHREQRDVIGPGGVDAAGPGAEQPARAPSPTRPGSPREGSAERADEERPPKPLQGRGLDLFGLRRRLGFGRTQSAPGDEGATGASEAAPRSAPQVDPPARERASAGSGADAVRQAAASAARPEAAVGVAEAADRAEAPARAAPAPQEGDIGAVEAYLARPDVPAIVRAERIAEELGMSVARADGALDRISENSERLSRIRAGAYMLRRRGES
jgi:hypothetical protein